MKKKYTELLHKDEFFTACAGANENNPAVVKIYEGLPPHILNMDEALNIARNKNRSINTFRRVIYFSPFSIGFEFGSSTFESNSLTKSSNINPPGKDSNLVVNPLRGTVVTIKDIKARMAKTPAKTVEEDEYLLKRKVLIHKQWEFFRKLNKLPPEQWDKLEVPRFKETASQPTPGKCTEKVIGHKSEDQKGQGK